MTQPPEALPLTLNRAVRIALENNLNLQAEESDTRASQALVRKGYGVYDPSLLLDLGVGDTQDHVNQPFFSAETRIKYQRYNFSLEQKLPTGADLALTFDNRRSEEDPAPPIDPAYRSGLRFSLVQPLLKGLGSTVTEQEILFAVKDREAAVSNLREQAIELLAAVRDSYFEVLRLRENLSYRETSVTVAAKILTEARARVEAGVMPPVDILEAEFGLKQRERERLDAERAYLDGLDNLAVLLGIRRPIRVSEQALEQPELAANPDRAFVTALTRRPDLQRRLREIERRELEARISRNALLPQLDLSASYGLVGLGGSFSDDLGEVGGGEFPGWEVGLALSYPLGNREARHEQRRLLLLLKGQRARVEQLKSEIRNEIRAAIRLLEVSRKVIDVTSSGLAFAEEKLRILLKRQEVGLATTRQVLEGEEDLAEAQTDWTTALADYNKAITGYYQVSGTLLDEAGVRLAGDLEDEATPLLQLEKP
jgi:outer membrane protein TolC